MRLTIAVAAMLASISAANAAVGDRFICHVANVRNVDVHGREDSNFIARNRQATYDIAIFADVILAVYKNQGEAHSREYAITHQTPLDVIGATFDGIAIRTAMMGGRPSPIHGNMYTATLTVQGSFFVNVWTLLCS